ncbi:FeoB-associated Cys-rich membrane protein [Clostridiales Family XIII bacterium RF-744-FAT-WT-3]|uniref:FeoB-associated Cys-rich membrane protein n=1 Tax=Baileyella intestinalis TaxID=2606709 RepID=A0A6A8M6U3_9FIRM|nr:FeoB-associated Cys-rich membrane protein [Baileyella intestinalis]MST68543.1 FeoB-associated Cys-rich membrane protein [Baileyella intestinalis]
MNFPSIIVALVIAVLAVLAMGYSLKNGSSCKNCGGNCSSCGHSCGTTEKTK